VLRPDEQVPFRDYGRRVLDTGEGQLTALFGDGRDPPDLPELTAGL
jgi:hypothetical protein